MSQSINATTTSTKTFLRAVFGKKRVNGKNSTQSVDNLPIDGGNEIVVMKKNVDFTNGSIGTNGNHRTSFDYYNKSPPTQSPSSKKKSKKQRDKHQHHTTIDYATSAVSDSTDYLTEALVNIADDQPRVARSIPKHAVVDTSSFAEHSLDNCLFDQTVYDHMVADSLKACDLLQMHLDDLVVNVRLEKSPSPVVRNNCVDDNDDERMMHDAYEQIVAVVADNQRIQSNDHNAYPMFVYDGFVPPSKPAVQHPKHMVHFNC
jgi:hypothetical protein